MSEFLRRSLHPGAWWLWALALVIAASQTTNPLLLALLFLVAVLTATYRAAPSAAAGAMWFFIKLAIIVIAIRVVIQVLFGAGLGPTVLVRLPALPLPMWMAGVHLGGAITLESVLAAAVDGLRFATIIVVIGAANVLAPAARLLKSVPTALYEVGVSVVVAMSFTPQLVSDVQRVQIARRLRGRSTRGVRAFAGSAAPVFEGALERSVTLAAAMDARGYGRTGTAPHRRTGTALLAMSLITAVLALAAFVAPGVPLGVGAVLSALACAAGALSLSVASRARVRTVYRPSPWRAAEWITVASGAATALCFIVGASSDPAGFAPTTDPAVWPTLPSLSVIGVLLAFIPLVITRKVQP